MRTLSILMLSLALASGVVGCSRDDDTSSTPRASRTSGSDDDRGTRTASRSDDDRDADEHADEHAGDDVTGAAEGSVASSSHAAPIAGAPPTAQEQPMANSDEDITRQIRQLVVRDGSLSVMARNATIVTQSGVVTLRGTVNEADERAALERHARSVSGVSRVDNRIAVRD